VTTWRPTSPTALEKEPVPIAASLNQITRQLRLPQPPVMTAIFGRWADAVGPEIAAHATPRTLRRGVLTVEVDHPAWATQLRFLIGDLLARLQAAAGPGEVTEVRIQVHADQASGGRVRRPGGPD
jgi:predicted nucleic acid-binding Zn ribbon protein